MKPKRDQSEKRFKKEFKGLEKKLAKKDEKINHPRFQLKKSQTDRKPETSQSDEVSVFPASHLKEADQELKKPNEELERTRTEIDEQVKEKTRELEE